MEETIGREFCMVISICLLSVAPFESVMVAIQVRTSPGIASDGVYEAREETSMPCANHWYAMVALVLSASIPCAVHVSSVSTSDSVGVMTISVSSGGVLRMLTEDSCTSEVSPPSSAITVHVRVSSGCTRSGVSCNCACVPSSSPF